MNAICRITDGTTAVDFLTGVFKLNTWPPKIAQAKGGGTWQDSPLVEGRHLVARVRGNVVEEYEFQVVALDEDIMARETQDLRRLLEKAVQFWTTDWQDEPVWLEVRGECETNTRYAVIKDWSTPNDEDPFGTIFHHGLQPGSVVMDSWLLLLERGQWLGSSLDVAATCVQLSNAAEQGDPTATGSGTYTPSASGDDAYVTYTSGSISTAGTSLFYGLDATPNQYGCGIRFRSVAIPAGAVIQYAFVRYVAAANQSNTIVQAMLRGELSASPAAFSTFADYINRTLTASEKAWSNVPAEVSGNSYDSPDITNIVQEIVDLAAWSSGDDMVIFIEDNGSDTSARREPSSWDHVTNNPPELHVGWYTAAHTIGRAATCDNEVYIANKHNDAHLTHIYVEDFGVGWGSNLLAGNPPYALLTAVPTANDAVYFGCSTADANSGPFGSLIFDLSQGGGTLTGFWEYYNGAGWSQLNPWGDQLKDETDNLGNTGVNGVFWDQHTAATWTVASLFTLFGGAAPNVTAYWLRFRVTAAGGAPTAPTQQTRHVYTLNYPDADLAAAQVVGDIVALSRIKLFNRSANALPASGPLLMANRAYIAARSASRGDAFRLWINLADEQQPPGVTLVTYTTVVSVADDINSATGRCVLFNPAAADPIADRCALVLDNVAAVNYYGSFKTFLRLRQVGGSSGDFTYRIRVETAEAGFIYRSNLLTVDPKPAAADEHIWLLHDIGRIDLIPTQLLANGDTLDELRIIFEIGNSNGTPGDLRLMDVGFLPIDEWACDCEDYSDSVAGSLSPTMVNLRFLDVDATGNSRRRKRALVRKDNVNEDITAIWVFRSNSMPALQANSAQSIYAILARYFESGGNAFWDGNPNIASSVQAFADPRYLAARGAR